MELQDLLPASLRVVHAHPCSHQVLMHTGKEGRWNREGRGPSPYSHWVS